MTEKQFKNEQLKTQYFKDFKKELKNALSQPKPTLHNIAKHMWFYVKPVGTVNALPPTVKRG